MVSEPTTVAAAAAPPTAIQIWTRSTGNATAATARPRIGAVNRAR